MDCNGIRADDAVGTKHRDGCVDLRGSVSVLINHVADVCCGAQEQAVGRHQRSVSGIRSHRSSPSIWVNCLNKSKGGEMC